MSKQMASLRFNRSNASNRRGATLVDVATGSMLLAVLLIPSIHVIGESQSCQRRLDQRDIMIYEAEQLIETTRIALSEPDTFDAAWATPVDVVRTISVSDGPDLVSRVRVAADSSLPTSPLLSIVIDVWRDLDGNRRMGNMEPSQSLRTQWAAP